MIRLLEKIVLISAAFSLGMTVGFAAAVGEAKLTGGWWCWLVVSSITLFTLSAKWAWEKD